MVSIRDKEAKDLLRKCKNHLRCLYGCGSKWAKIVRDTTEEIELASGAVIRSTTSSAAGRGFTGNVIVDEYAYQQDQQAVWDAAIAASTHGFKVRICSTPNGIGDIWHQLCTELGHADEQNPKGWLIYQTTINDAVADGMRIDMEEAWDMARHDQRIFDQLFMGVFLDGDMQYFQTDLLDRATVEYLPPQYGQTVAGLDIGETQDRTALIILRQVSGRWRKLHSEVHGKTDDLLIASLIDKALVTYGCTSIGIDKTGMGTFPTRAAQRKHGGKVNGIVFGQKSKEEMATSLYQALVDGTIELQKGDSDLRSDLASIRRVVTPGGTVRFEAPRTNKGHADLAWALMLANMQTARANVAGAYSGLRALRGA
jgi:phage FluMu gp28-like protein